MANPHWVFRMPRPARRRGRLLGGLAIAVALAVAGIAADRAWIAAAPERPITVVRGADGDAAAEVVVIRGGGRDAARASPPAVGTVATGAVTGVAFTRCGVPSYDNCVIDGDSFHLGGRPIRIADIDAPEVGEPACMDEAELGRRATDRLLALLNAGSFTLADAADAGAGHDRHGRELRLVLRDGQSLGATLAAEGLARAWNGPAIDWCATGGA